MATNTKRSAKKQQSAKQAPTPISEAYAPPSETLDATLPDDTYEEFIEAALGQLDIASGAVELLKRAAMCPFPMSAESALAAAHMIERQIELVREELLEPDDRVTNATPPVI